jgi:hypothetical protein
MKNKEIKQKLNLRKKTYSKKLITSNKNFTKYTKPQTKKGISQTKGYAFHITGCK